MAKSILSLTLLTAAALLATACVSTGPAPPDQARLPTEQWTDKVGLTEAPRLIRLAPHPGGLSQSQADALSQFAQDWAASSGGEVRVIAPAASQRLGVQAADYLRQAGVSQVRLGTIDAPAGFPVEIAYTAVEAVVPLCGQRINNYAANGSNGVDPNFGCAVTANRAAMVANPQDLVRPRDAGPVSAARAVEALTRSMAPPAAGASGSAPGGSTGGSGAPFSGATN